ncbi:MAG: Eco47II family restriction endonuclease [Holosporales bacterium]|jgi:hypothetical protein
MTLIFPNAAAQAIVTSLVHKVKQSAHAADTDFYKNKVDPFSALIDSMLQGIPLSSWVRQEKVRQSQKTLQNCIGNFHQSIIASFDGWEDLGTGKIIDLRNNKRQIIAEIKNKYNTTKGSHKIQIYRDIKATLDQPDHKEFIGYYVEIIPSGHGIKTLYDKPFVPSDNTKSGERMIARDDIRLIDGRSFYKIVTGAEDALYQLYKGLPEMIRRALNDGSIKPENEDLFSVLFEKVFT